MLKLRIILLTFLILLLRMPLHLFASGNDTVDLIDQCEPAKKNYARKLASKLLPEKLKGLTISKICLRKKKPVDDSEIDNPTKDSIIELNGIKKWPKELIYDQGNLGSCTANALAFCIRYLSIRNSCKPNKFIDNSELLSPSRLYFYYNSRYLSGLVKRKSITKKDTGATLAESVTALQRYGCCPETFSDELACSLGPISYGGWGYSKRQFSTQPTPENYRFAFDSNYKGEKVDKLELEGSDPNPYAIVSKNICSSDLYAKYSNNSRPLNKRQKKALVEEFKNSLSKDIPIFFGIDHNGNFDDNECGFIKTPEKKNFSSLGAHAITIVGYGKYNPSKPDISYFKFINSYGPDWGDKGYGYLEEDYVAEPSLFSAEAYAIDLRKMEAK